MASASPGHSPASPDRAPQPNARGRGRRTSSSLERGLAILGCFEAPNALLGISELASRLGMAGSTVHRYVLTLVQLGYLQQDPGTRKYSIGYRAVDLALAVFTGHGLADLARPHLESLSREVGKTVSLAVLDGMEIVYVARVANPGGITLDLRIGSRLPVHCTAMGKMLLAGLDKAELHRRLEGYELTRMTVHTVTDPEKLAAQVNAAGLRGYATSNQELTNDLRTVAAPVRNHEGRIVAAVNLAAGASTYSQADLQRQLLPLVITAAARISADCGHRDSRA